MQTDDQYEHELHHHLPKRHDFDHLSLGFKTKSKHTTIFYSQDQENEDDHFPFLPWYKQQ